MRRHVLVPAIGITVLMSLGAWSSGLLGVGLGSPAQAADIAHSRFANHISGFVLQDLASGLPNQPTSPGQRPTNATPEQPTGGIAPTTGTSGCSQVSGNNVRVNQDCTNNTSPKFPGRGQAQNETSIAINPTNAQNLLGGQNDYRRGDGGCGADYSLDGGQHWGSSLIPVGFTVPGVDDPKAARHYWSSSGDPAVAFDSQGAAYYQCMVFDRASPTQDNHCANPAGSCASGIFVFRSVNGGASWDFPGGPTASVASGKVITTPGIASQTQFTLEDKPYMGIDSNPSSRFRDRIYVSWTHYTPCNASSGCETDPIYFAYSNDHGLTFSTPQSISGSSASLCQVPLNPSTPNACDNDSFSQPVVAANGDVYVVFTNYNNRVTGSDNHNDILAVKSTDGGAHFGAPTLVSKYFDFPDCVTYTGDDAFRGCVPTNPLSGVSVFRAANYPSAAADPNDGNKIYVTFASYINPHSRPDNPRGQGNCSPNGLSKDTGLNLYFSVGDVGGCNNDILLSTTNDGGKTWTAAQTGPAHATVVSDESPNQFADQWWQWAAINASGQLVVSYYDRKYGTDERDGNNDISLAAASSTGFAHERVTDISTAPPTEFPDQPNGYSVFFGDYSGLAVSGTTAYPLWSDSRNLEFFQCPSNAAPLGECRLTNGNVPGTDEDVFSTTGLGLPH